MPVDVECPYCQQQAQFVDSAEIYQGRSYGFMYWCKPCDAYVGIHKNSKDHKPLGRLANKELREWKQRAHAIFDPLWQRRLQIDGCAKHEARNAGYAWLAGRMGIDVKRCHIGHFDVDQCKMVLEICAPYRKVSD